MKKQLTVLFKNVEQAHLGKDVFLVPYYLGKIHNMSIKIVFIETENNSDIPKEHRGVKLERIKPGKIHREIAFVKYLIQNARKIDFLVLFHLKYFSAVLGILYKILNKKGYLYLKSDGLGFAREETMASNSFMHNMAKPLYRCFLKHIDMITTETRAGYNLLTSKSIYGVDLSKKTKQLPNGFDDDLFKTYDMPILDYNHKENLIITVGRLGVFEKNTEMLLEAAKNLDFKDWKIALIGPVELDFQKDMDTFLSENPSLQGKVFFIGPIYNKEILWSWYNRAKVFVLTSRIEGYAIVYAEALKFNNYIVTTDVGGATETLELGKGKIIEKENAQYLNVVLQSIIDQKIDTKPNLKSNKSFIGWKDLISKIRFSD